MHVYLWYWSRPERVNQLGGLLFRCVEFVQRLLLAMQAAADSWKYFLDWKGDNWGAEPLV